MNRLVDTLSRFVASPGELGSKDGASERQRISGRKALIAQLRDDVRDGRATLRFWVSLNVVTCFVFLCVLMTRLTEPLVTIPAGCLGLYVVGRQAETVWRELRLQTLALHMALVTTDEKELRNTMVTLNAALLTQARSRPPVSLFFVGSSPRDQVELRVSAEHAAIDSHERCLDVHSRLNASFGDVRQQLARRRATIVHFAGHGARHGNDLVLQDHDGAAHPVDVKWMGEVLKIARETRLVVFNVCESLPLARAALAKERAAIGWSGSVLDQDAIEFSRALYDGIAGGRSLADAFAAAKAAHEVELERRGRDGGARDVRPSGVEASRVRPPSMQRAEPHLCIGPGSRAESRVLVQS